MSRRLLLLIIILLIIIAIPVMIIAIADFSMFLTVVLRIAFAFSGALILLFLLSLRVESAIGDISRNLLVLLREPFERVFDVWRYPAQTRRMLYAYRLWMVHGLMQRRFVIFGFFVVMILAIIGYFIFYTTLNTVLGLSSSAIIAGSLALIPILALLWLTYNE